MNLSTRYMGLELASPIVVSACTLSERLDHIRAMEDAGAGAVVLFSVFEEQIRREQRLFDAVVHSTAEQFPEASDFFPATGEFQVGTDDYLELIRGAKESCDLPVIASLNGVTPEGWVEFSRDMAEAGADAIELNVYYIPADIRLDGREVEQRYLDIIRTVHAAVGVPIALKLNPYFSALGHFALQSVEAGADALVLFNRFFQPDFDIADLSIRRDLTFSGPREIRLPLLWIAALHGRLPASLAATSGVDGATEIVKYLLAGADVAMTASALYRHGIGHLATLTSDLCQWMERHGFDSVDAFRGLLSQKNVPDPDAFERANYVNILEGAHGREPVPHPVR